MICKNWSKFLSIKQSLLLIITYFNYFCTPCQPPDVPVGGSFSPILGDYLAGDRIYYFCNQSFLIGQQQRICQTNGRWTDHSPFCENSVKLKNPIGSSASRTYPQQTIDGNISTCFSTTSDTGVYYRVYLDTPAVINVIRLFLPRGTVNLEISLVRQTQKLICKNLKRLLEEDQWLIIKCDTESMADSIRIQEISDSKNALRICEVEVFVKENIWCNHPPDVFVPNGWLQISRDKATLQCKQGFKPGKHVRLVCDARGSWSQTLLQCEEILCSLYDTNGTINGEWRIIGTQSKLAIGTTKVLKCNEGYFVSGNEPNVKCLPSGEWSSSSARCKKIPPSPPSTTKGSKYNGIIIAASTVVSIIILTCSALVIFLVIKKKSKPVVVVVKQNEGGGSLHYNETEYSSVNYEAASSFNLNRYPSPPRSRPPLPVETDYSNTIDQQSPPPYNESQGAYSDPSDALTKSQENLFKTLKVSPVYGK